MERPITCRDRCHAGTDAMQGQQLGSMHGQKLGAMHGQKLGAMHGQTSSKEVCVLVLIHLTLALVTTRQVYNKLIL